MTTLRMLLVDQNDDFLDAVIAWLGAAGTVEIVGRSHAGADAVARVERQAPDVVVMDMALPDMSVLEATRRMKRCPGAPLVILTSFHDSRAARAAAVDAGADECISKADVMSNLLPAIARLVDRRAAAGEGRPALQDQSGRAGSMPAEETVSPIRPKEREER